MVWIAFTALALAGKIIRMESEAINPESDSEPKVYFTTLTNGTLEFLKTLRVCAMCDRFERFGSWFDGGYETCVDDLSKGSISAAFSMGVSDDDSWGVQVNKKFDVPVYQFDCTVSQAPPCPGCHFFQKCVVSDEEKNLGLLYPNGWSLEDVLRETNTSKVADRSLILKMDIEGSEWNILDRINVDLLRKFRVISIELHGLGNQSGHWSKLRSMRKLQDAGFLVAKMHENNYAASNTFLEYSFPEVVELNLVSNSARKMEICDNHLSDGWLDFPNDLFHRWYYTWNLPSLLQVASMSSDAS